MSRLHEVGAWIEGALPGLLAEHEVPAASVALMLDGQVFATAHGLLSKATGVEATTDSVFQIGSITKLWTTSLAMQLVDEGKLGLDDPVRLHLPEFRLADEESSAAITVRQLMTHTSGFGGDVFTDTGYGDDCVEKYVATLTDQEQIFPPGRLYSYNNAGFVVLGRIIEVLRGRAFDDCLTEYLIRPLRLAHAATGPYQAILHRAAVGHTRTDEKQEPRPTELWALQRSTVPAGAMLAMSASDLMVFARMHLEDGVGPDGERVLSEQSVRAMREAQIALPRLTTFDQSRGLGWAIYDLDGGGRLVGHNGNTIGQSAFFQTVPEQSLAIAVLTNGGNAPNVWRAILERVLRDLAGLTAPPEPVPDPTAAKADYRRFVGRYSAEGEDDVMRMDEDGRVFLDYIPTGVSLELGELPESFELLPYAGNVLISAERRFGSHFVVAFLGDDGEGRTPYLYGSRIARRVPE
ncbi:MAG TPA: serine hydrolase domain-containing protein [Actinospica sp.]|nr:serine hydrolase domain-containing protein [Actinospica sp.]